MFYSPIVQYTQSWFVGKQNMCLWTIQQQHITICDFFFFFLLLLFLLCVRLLLLATNAAWQEKKRVALWQYYGLFAVTRWLFIPFVRCAKWQQWRQARKESDRLEWNSISKAKKNRRWEIKVDRFYIVWFAHASEYFRFLAYSLYFFALCFFSLPRICRDSVDFNLRMQISNTWLIFFSVSATVVVHSPLCTHH